ncbi:alpha/beta fold hydrolase [Streptomyces sp. NPDC002018]|uniref:alpha/beta fold hydrolase n=1 Tax=Streptomyces sp. NPDC002018 TaxID=3364629 RepID=UPI0036BE60D6
MTVTATALLVLHTWGGDGRTWAPALPFLCADGRAVEAPDLPGHGGRADEPFTPAGALEAASACAAALDGGRPVDVVGSGLGALIALALTRQRPHAVRSLTLVGFPPAGGPAAAGRLAQTEERLRREGTAAFARSYAEGTLRGSGPARRALLRDAMAATRARTLLDSLRATLGWAGDAPPRPLGSPCLVLRGAYDERVGEDAAKALAGQLGGVYGVVPGAGHVAYLDEPEAFAAVLLDFHGGLDHDHGLDHDRAIDHGLDQDHDHGLDHGHGLQHHGLDHGLDRTADGPVPGHGPGPSRPPRSAPAGRYGTEPVPPVRHSSGPPTRRSPSAER